MVQYYNSEGYDYAIATIDHGADVRMTNKVYNETNYTTINSGLEDDPVVGEIICRYGKNSKFATYYVDAVDVTSHSDNRYFIRRLVACTLRSGNNPQSGDSGGPFFRGHEFYGVLHGNNGIQTFYSPFKGVTIKFSLW